MKISKLLAAAVLCSAPIFASTYFGGAEDMKNGNDHDYNDLVFSLSGSSLKLVTTDGKWYSQPALGTSGTPFWNNRSHDGATPAERDTYNVGYCIYGGGTCNAGAALDPGAQFLASSKLASTEDVYFTTDASVDANVYLTITAIDDALGWYATTDPSTIHWINTAAATGEFYFTPGGSFGLAMNTADAQTDKKGILQGTTYYSQDVYGTTDHDESHFAFFSTPAPEPGMMGLVGAGLLVAGSIFRRKKHTQN